MSSMFNKMCLFCLYARKINTLKPGSSIQIDDIDTTFCNECKELLKFAKVTYDICQGKMILGQSIDSRYNLPQCRRILENTTSIKKF